MLLDPLPLSQTVTLSRTLSPSSVTYFMDGPYLTSITTETCMLTNCTCMIKKSFYGGLETLHNITIFPNSSHSQLIGCELSINHLCMVVYWLVCWTAKSEVWVQVPSRAEICFEISAPPQL